MNIDEIFSNQILFGEILRYWRESRGWTRKELAEKLEMHQSNIQRYEEGKIKNISMQAAQKIIDVFGVSAEYFFSYDVIDALSQKSFSNFCKSSGVRTRRSFELRVVSKIIQNSDAKVLPDLEELGLLLYECPTDRLKKKDEEGIMNPAISIHMYGLTVDTDFESLLFLLGVLCNPTYFKDDSIGSAEEMYTTNEKDKAMEISNIIGPNFFGLIQTLDAIKPPTYNNNPMSRKKYLTAIKQLLKVTEDLRVSHREFIDLTNGLNQIKLQREWRYEK